jgi:hypothetical protein
MRVDQKNTATTPITTNGIATDRWYVEDSCDAVLSAQQSTDVPTGEGFSKSLKVTATTADASIGATEFSVITQHIEGINTSQLAWGAGGAKPIVVSFWVKATTTGTYSFTVYNNGASRLCPNAYTVNASNTWEKKTIYINGDITGTWLTDTGRGVTCNFYTALGTNYLGTSGVWNGSNIYGVIGQANAWASTNNIFAITGVQVEQNLQPTPFEHRPIGVELALCQRYYFRANPSSQASKNLNSMGTYYSSTAWYGTLPFPVQMRSAPTFTSGTISSLGIYSNSDVRTVLTLIQGDATVDSALMNATTGARTAGHAGWLWANSATNSFLEFSSEL